MQDLYSILVELAYGDDGLCGGRKLKWYPEKNPQSKPEPTTNSTHYWNPGGIKHEPHWWEISLLTTAHSCSPKYNLLLKTGPLYNTVQEFSLAEPSWIISHYAIYILGQF